MKQYKGTTVGTDFKGVMRFSDILEMQNKAITSINNSDSTLSIFRGCNAYITATGLSVSEGIVLWGGFPATLEAVSNIPINDKKYFVITVEPQDNRDVVVNGETFNYDAYDYYKATISTQYCEVGSQFKGHDVVGCIPYFLRSDDYVIKCIIDNDITEADGTVIDYLGEPAYVMTAGNDHYILLSGVVIGDEDLATQLSGYCIDSFVFFGDTSSVERQSISVSLPQEVNNVPAAGNLGEIIAQLIRNVNSIKQVAYTSDYLDLENKLRIADDLNITMEDLVRQQIPLQGTLKQTLSLIRAAVKDLQRVAYSGSYLDLSDSPRKLSDFTNDLDKTASQDFIEIRMIPVSQPIPEGWHLCDGTDGTIDLRGFIPQGYKSSSNPDSEVPEHESIGDFVSADTAVQTTFVQFIQKMQATTNYSITLVSNNPTIGTLGTSNLGGVTNITLVKELGTSLSIYAVPLYPNKFNHFDITVGQDISNSTQNPYTFSLSDNISIRAYFDTYYSVTLNVDSPTNIGYVSTDISPEWVVGVEEVVVAGTTLILRAQEPTDPETYSFTGFFNDEGTQLDATLSEGVWTCTIQSISHDYTITASYYTRPTINVDVSPANTGTVSINPEGPYSLGQSVELTAHPVGINRFTNFSYVINGVREEFTNNPLTVVLNNNLDIDANFVEVFNTIARTEDGSVDRGTVAVNDSDSLSAHSIDTDKGTVLHLKATPEVGWNFVQWYGNEGVLSFSPEFDYNVQYSNTLSARFTRIYNTLTFVPANNGVITGSGQYEYGSTVTVTATANVGYYFVNWVKVTEAGQEQISTESTYQFVITEDMTITANFAIIQYTVSAVSEDETMGTVMGGGQYNYGATAQVSASPAIYHRFVGWYESDILQATNSVFQFLVNRDWDLIARFERVTNTITLVADPSRGGVVVGAGEYPMGTSREIEAIPSTGYSFVGWYNGQVQISTNNPLQFQLISDINYTAKFEVLSVTLTLSSNDETMGTVSGGGTFTYGDFVTIAAYINNGYNFRNWINQNDGTIFSTNREFSFSITENLSLQAVFYPITYVVEATSNNTSLGTVSGGGSYSYGSRVTLRATPIGSSTFVGWYQDNIQVSTSTEYTITVNGNVQLVAYFE